MKRENEEALKNFIRAAVEDAKSGAGGALYLRDWPAYAHHMATIATLYDIERVARGEKIKTMKDYIEDARENNKEAILQTAKATTNGTEPRGDGYIQ